MLRIKVAMQVEYVNKTEINHKARITVGIVASVVFAKVNSFSPSPTINKMFSVAVKIISECENCTSLSPPFFFLIENGANPRNLDT